MYADEYSERIARWQGPDWRDPDDDEEEPP